ncbi:MAG TPA: alanine--glyoxylate aminotransferase family protein [bacterium]|nr:alanine--glyoxylate aminotransferase family protein [bacterium]
MKEKDILLHIPGPIPVEADVLAAMAQQVRQHYGDEWLAYYRVFIDRLRQVYATTGSVYPIPSSGSGGVEAMMGSLIGPDGRVGVIVNGFFGNRVLQIARAYSAQVETLEIPWDRPADPGEVRTWLRRTRVPLLGVVHSDTSTGVINPVAEIAAAAREEGVAVAVDAVSSLAGMPVETDAWGLAAVSSASQKCLEAPPGLAPVAITQVGWDVIDRQPGPARGWYLNLRTWREFEHNWPHHPYPVTIATNNIFALDRALERILAEGLEARYARHRRAQQMLRRGLERLGFTLLADDRWASPTITVAYPPKGVDADALIGGLRTRHGVAIAGGLTQLAGKVVRIGHLGTQAYPERMQRVLDALEACLKERTAARA